MTLLKLLCFAALAAVSAGAFPTTFSTDQTDFWYARGESGWAINVSHQGDTVFVTWYVYASDGKPVWYSGSAAGSTSGGKLAFSGDLYETGGPWFGAPAYDPSRVAYRKVGTFQFEVAAQASASLTYSVDGVTVRKTLERFTFKSNDLTGNYYAVVTGTPSGCGGATEQALDTYPLVVTHAANNDVRLVVGRGGECTVVGSYVPTGRLGAVSGSMACAGGLTGTYALSEVEANASGITARITQVFGSCRFDGRIAAVAMP